MFNFLIETKLKLSQYFQFSTAYRLYQNRVFLISLPQHQLNFAVKGKIKPIELELGMSGDLGMMRSIYNFARHQSSILPDYFLLDVFLKKSIFEHGDIEVRIANLLNHNNQVLNSLRSFGRQFYLKLKIYY